MEQHDEGTYQRPRADVVDTVDSAGYDEQWATETQRQEVHQFKYSLTVVRKEVHQLHTASHAHISIYISASITLFVPLLL